MISSSFLLCFLGLPKIVRFNGGLGFASVIFVCYLQSSLLIGILMPLWFNQVSEANYHPLRSIHAHPCKNRERSEPQPLCRRVAVVQSSEPAGRQAKRTKPSKHCRLHLIHRVACSLFPKHRKPPTRTPPQCLFVFSQSFCKSFFR